MNNEPVAWMCQDNVTDEWEFSSMRHCYKCEPLYTHPVKELFKDAKNRDELIGQEFETYLEKLTQDFKDGFREGVLFCEDVAKRPELYGQDTHPVKELTETNYETVFDGEKYTTKIVEPKAKELTQDEILDIWYAMEDDSNNWTRYVEFARAILRKAQEK